MDRGAPSERITGTLMVLFAPNPFSFYRVTEYDDVERAKEWCERFAAITFQPTYVRLTVWNAIEWQDIAADNNSFEVRCNKEHRYMVLYQALEGLYRMFGFEHPDDAVHHALTSRTRLQEMRASQQTGLPESVQVFACILRRRVESTEPAAS
jgi:hypothetical protein